MQSPPGNTSALNARAPVTGSDVVRSSLWIVEGRVEPGAIFTLALVLEIAPTWHVYWRNPGDSGIPPSLAIDVPEGFALVGELAFPRPSILSKHEVTYGYEGKVALFQRVRAPNSIPAELQLRAKAKWMTCKSTCLIGESTLAVTVAPATHTMPRPIRDVVDAARFQLPTPFAAAKAWSAEVIREPNGSISALALTGKFPTKAISQRPIIFIPDVTPGVSYGSGAPISARFEGEESSASALLSIPLLVDPANAAGKNLRAAGLILIGDGSDSADHCYSIDVPIAPTPFP